MDITTAHLLDSLGWAVTHSLWQGVIAAIAVFVFRAVTKDRQAGLRCGFELLALSACFFAFVFTFLTNLVAPVGSITAPTFTDVLSAPVIMPPGMSGSAVAAGLAGPDITYYTPLLGIFWCLGFALLATRYIFGFILTHRLRTLGLSPVPSSWQDRFETLVLNAGIFRKVSFHISERVSGPVTLGFFKPIVLVPASFFSGLPAAQIEAILLHEIAHIRRHDYMINLVQTAIKTVLFFHPAIHYISKRIDEDREKACDDFAVNYTRDPRSLARGLATLRLNLAPPDFAMAASSKNTPLIQRLTRLTTAEEPRRRRGQLATSITAAVLAGGLYTATQVEFASAHPPDQLHRAKNQIIPVSDPRPDFNQDLLWNEVTIPLASGPTPDPAPRVKPAPVVNPAPTPQPKPAPLPRPFPITPRETSELAGAPSLSDWEANVERRLETLEEKYESEMDQITDKFEDALDAFEEASEKYSQDPVMLQGYFKRAEANFASAVLLTNEKRAELKFKFNHDIEKIVEHDIKRHVDRYVTIAMSDAQREIAEAQREAEHARRTALREAEVSRKMALKEAERGRLESLAQAERIRKEAARYTTYPAHTPTYENYGQSMLIKLRSDGIIDTGASSADVSYRDGDMYVNGAKVSHDLENNYCALNKAYNVPKTDNMRIEIRPQRLTITNYNN